MTRILLALIIALPVLGQAAVGTLSGSVTYKGNPTAFTGYVAYLDLSKGLFRPVVTGLYAACRSAGNGQVYLTPTTTFATANHTLLAITANSGPGTPTGCGVPSGLIIAKGKLVNPGETNGPVLYFNPPFTSGVITSSDLPAGVQWAVAGTTYVNNDCPDFYQPGTLLVAGGNPGPCAIPKGQIPAARTGAGLDKTNTILIVAATNGSDGSSGLTTADFAKLMIGLGAVNAVNFDGGGSTTFFWTPSQSQMPTQSQTLAAMLTNAKVPSFLSFQAKLAPIGTPISFDNDSQRPVYASLGFTFSGP